jgi:hypothetical protein
MNYLHGILTFCIRQLQGPYPICVVSWCFCHYSIIKMSICNFFRVRKTMIRSLSGDVQQSQKRKMNIDRRDEWWLFLLNELIPLQKVCPPSRSWLYFRGFSPFNWRKFFFFNNCAAVDILSIIKVDICI